MARKRSEAEPTEEGQVLVLAALREAGSAILAVAAADTDIPAQDLAVTFEQILALLEHPDDVAAHDVAFYDSGARAARSSVSGGVVLDAYLSLNWAIWEAVMGFEAIDHETAMEVADRLMRGMDSAIAALTRGYISVEIELVAAHSERRRSVLEELFTSRRNTPEARARLQALARRYGLQPDAVYRLILMLDPAVQDEAPAEAVDRLEHLVRAPVSHHRDRPGIRLPVVMEWRGQVLLFVQARWAGEASLRKALPGVLGEDWLVVDIRTVEGVEALDEALAEAEYTLSVARRLGDHGWIGDPSELALETTFLVDRPLSRAAIERELGPLLADERMGEEFIETLQAYLASGQNTRETARRMHLAERTVAYRLQRIESLLGKSLASDAAMRIGAALVALKVMRETGGG